MNWFEGEQEHQYKEAFCLMYYENEQKHGVSFLEASEVFNDDHSSSVQDPDHSVDEDRYLGSRSDAGAGPIEEVHQSDDVDRCVERGLVHRHPHVDLRGVMIHEIEAAAPQRLDGLRIAQVRLDQLGAPVHVLAAAVEDPDDDVAAGELGCGMGTAGEVERLRCGWPPGSADRGGRPGGRGRRRGRAGRRAAGRGR